MITKVHLDHTDLELWVGSLEKTILCAFWVNKKELTATQLHRYLIQNGGTWSYNTIVTTLLRMHDKQLLDRIEQKHSKYCVWFPIAKTEDDFIVSAIKHTLNRLFEEYPRVLIDNLIVDTGADT